MEALKCLSIALVVAITAAVFQVVAYVAPLWLWVQYATSSFAYGLWYIVVHDSTSGSTSTTIGTYLSDDDTLNNNWKFNVVRGTHTAAVIGAVLVCVFLFGLRAGWRKSNNVEALKWGSILVAIITCVCIAVGNGFLIGYFDTNLTSFYENGDDSSVPWSVILSFLCLLFLVIVIILLIMCKDHNPLDKLPISGDPKMALTPTITNANNDRRYFVPSPYTDDRRSANFSDGSPSRYDDQPLYKGVSKKEYQSGEYNPFYHRPRSDAESIYSKQHFGPSFLAQRNDLDQRSFHSIDRRPPSYAERPVYTRVVRRDEERVVQPTQRYQERYEEVTEPNYPKFIERSRPAPTPQPPPTGERSILSAMTDMPTESQYTTKFKDGLNTSYIYRPYAPQRY